MSKLYNTFSFCSSAFVDFFSSLDTLSKNQLNFIGDFFTSMLNSSSINFDKIALDLSSIYPDVKLDSILKRISRFLNNPNNDFHFLFNSIISHIFDKFKIKHNDRVFIVFDHMFVREKFTVFMLSLKIGKQGIPIFFKVFEGKNKKNFGLAFKIDMIKESLLYVHNLFKNINPDIEIVFLADRWFDNYFPLFNFINDVLKDSFVFRCKDNFKIFFQPKGENHKIWMTIHDLRQLKYHSTLYENLEFTKRRYKFNLTVCKSSNHKERWFLISNVPPKRARMFYSYRFGGIETIFKNQKTNGFYLEKTGVKHLHAFDNLYSLLCIANAYFVCLGSDVSKNTSCYQNIGFKSVKRTKNGNIRRVISVFTTGLRLFHLAFNSSRYYRLPFTFTLYDI